MKNKLYSSKNNGFTLIELLVVISIIGTLSSVVLASLSGSKDKANDAKKMVEVKSISTAIELYKSSNNGEGPGSFQTAEGHYATDIGDGSTIGPAVEGSVAYETAMGQLVTAKVLPAIPRSPDGESYSYLNTGTADGNGTAFTTSLNNGNTFGVSSLSVKIETGDIAYYFRLPSTGMNLENLNLRQTPGWVSGTNSSLADLLYYTVLFGQNDYATYTFYYYNNPLYPQYTGWRQGITSVTTVPSEFIILGNKKTQSMTWQLPAGTIYYGSQSVSAGWTPISTAWFNDFKAKYYTQ
ncbi:MAG: type II secretion system protein [Candidatus Paceibacterota bacterium]|jgi:prepilin-type N-terminal cleavage/methylation domain-containing protein